MNWDDLQIVRAIFRTGSFAAAARLLNVNETTVSRRLLRLEEDLDVSLFEAVDGNRVPTNKCEQIVELIEKIARHTDQVTKIANIKQGHVEKRRIAATDSVTVDILAPNVPAFLSAHPELELEFLTSTENVDFSRWEADLAIRLKRPDRGNFLITKLAEMLLYFVEPKTRAASSEALVCAYPADLDLTPESEYLMGRGLHQIARCRSKNLLVIKQMIRTKRCRGILPGFMCGDLSEANGFQLTRLSNTRGAWLLTQSHLRKDPVTRTVINWIKDCFASDVSSFIL